ncbi:MAG: B12-binding domain-containing radical SAM protein, partial [Candidatus Hecatellales archaeon]
MKVLLVQPPIPPEVELHSTAGMVAPSMGLAYLAAVLEQAGYKVEILDAPALELTYEKLAGEIERRRPDVVGVTATTAVSPSALKTIR